MARPRVFISSTYYDLKHLRSSLENFVESLGFEAVLSEKGKIAYAPDVPLDESCYREVAAVDVFVLIVGGRYGSEASATKGDGAKTFFERYNSITRGEYRTALEREVPLYILIERSVYAEYETYLRNKGNTAITYAHVDSVNIFELIDDILSQPRNNPIQQFDKYTEIESWLRDQWSGLFRELLQRIRTQAQLATLQDQVAQLSELNRTLKTYLEEIVSRVAPAESKTLIESETKRLREAQVRRAILGNPLGRILHETHSVPLQRLRTSISQAASLDDFLERVAAAAPAELAGRVRRFLEISRDPASRDLDRMRESLGLHALKPDNETAEARSVTETSDDARKPVKASKTKPARSSKRK